MYSGWRRYFLTMSALRGPMVGFSPALHFLLGNQENEGSHLSLSWSPRGELGVGVGATVGFLGAGVGATVGFLGVGVVGCVFVLDMVLVTCEL